MVGVTHTSYTHTQTRTHIKHGSGDLCLADFNHARWPLDDEWQAAPLSLSLLLPSSLSFYRPAGIPICPRPAEGQCVETAPIFSSEWQKNGGFVWTL